jgi:hypothetical protein
LRCHGWIDMTRSAFEGFGRSLEPDDGIEIEAAGNVMSVVRVLSPFAGIVANPTQAKRAITRGSRPTRSDSAFRRLQASGSAPCNFGEGAGWRSAECHLHGMGRGRAGDARAARLHVFEKQEDLRRHDRVVEGIVGGKQWQPEIVQDRREA